MKQNHALEVEQKLSQYPVGEFLQDPSSYIGGGQSNKRYIGIRVPHIQLALKDGFSFSKKDRLEQAKIWHEIWNSSDCFEVMASALYWFDHKKLAPHLPEFWILLKTWTNKIDNWAHSDGLCSIYAKILESDSRVYSQLEKWSRSKESWERRISIVSLLNYSAQRKKILPYSKLIPLVDRQKNINEYYVQKGFGWTLRELGNVYPKQTQQYIDKNILKLSSIAFSTATEKITKSVKEKWKAKRKTKRSRAVKATTQTPT